MAVRVTSAPRRRVGCLLGGCLGLVVVVALAGAVAPLLALNWLPGLRQNLVLPGIGPLADLVPVDTVLRSQFGIEQRDIPGDPRRFDPDAGLAVARELAGDGAELVAVRLSGVRADGTLDLQAGYRPAPDAEYRFTRRLAQPPPNAPPVGAGGSVTGVWYEPIVVRFSEPGQRRQITSGRNQITYNTTGLDRRTETPVTAAPAVAPPPACAPATLWQQALARGAPADAVARIEYARDGYSFAITGTPVNLRFGPDCQPRR